MKTMIGNVRRVLGALTLVVAFAATASYAEKEANGNIALSGPLQYVKFDASTEARELGQLTYTNFDYPALGTNVWDVRGWTSLIVNLGSGAYPHSVTIANLSALSNVKTSFTGSGNYVPDSSYTWNVTGTVSKNVINFKLVYTGTSAGYTFLGTGTIAPDGSMSGTATDSLSQSPLTWTAPAGSAHEVLNYKADLSCVKITGKHANLGFTIPSAPIVFSGLSGLPIAVQVQDGPDTYAHGVASSASLACNGTTAVNQYTITSGNIEVESH